MQHRTIVLKVPVIVLTLVVIALAQAGRTKPPAEPIKKAKESQTTKPEVVPGADQQEPEAVKLGTTLVTASVIASDRNGLYIPDMRKEEFSVFEDGVKQEVIFFGTVKEPFHVVLMLDTSASAQEKLGQIQRAAIAFVEQLQSADRVKGAPSNGRLSKARRIGAACAASSIGSKPRNTSFTCASFFPSIAATPCVRTAGAAG
jgi:hypothetical protein